MEPLDLLPPSRVLLLTLLFERGSPRTPGPPALPRCVLPAWWLVQGYELGAVQDIVPVSDPVPGLAAGHDGGWLVGRRRRCAGL